MPALGGGMLVITDIVTGSPAWWFYPVTAIIVSWLVHFAVTLDLPKALASSTHRRG